SGSAPTPAISTRSRSFTSCRHQRNVRLTLRPKIMKHDRGDDDTEHNADDPVSDLVEIRIRREALKNAHEKGKRDLQTRVSNPRAAGTTPSGQRRSGRSQKDQRHDALHARHEIHDSEKTKQTANRASDQS